MSHFFWSNTTDWQTSGKEPYAESYAYSTQATNDVFFTNATWTTANPSFQVSGETAGTWRTLSLNEWNYLLDNSEDLGSCELKWLTVTEGVSVWGFVLLPDGTENPSTVLESIISVSDLATYDAVFLLAAGYRNEWNTVANVNYEGYYCPSNPNSKEKASVIWFNEYMSYLPVSAIFTRDGGFSVRLVRDITE